MKHYVHGVAVIGLSVMLVAGRALGQSIAPQQSTTGPVPPPSVGPKIPLVLPREGGGTQRSITGVPGYCWRHGCGPTAVGMVIGYYTTHGFADLIPGDASTQSAAVNQSIASQGSGIRGTGTQRHYENYSLPDDSGSPSVIADSSETYPTGCHTDDSIADFMHTSWSHDSNKYGWSWSDRIGPAFTSYVNLKNSAYSPTYVQYYMSSTLTWSVLTNEINNNHPMAFLVDSDGDGQTDHFVTVIAYSDSPSQQYGCLDTWGTCTQIRWCNFRPMSTSYAWGVWGGWAFGLALPPAIAVAPASHDFGYVQVNTTADCTFYVTNTGGGTLSGSANVPAPFSVVSGGSYSLTANAWQAVVVRYSPTVPGTNSTNVTFTGGGGATRSVTGAAYAAPAIAVSPASQDFGYIQVNTMADRTFYVTNAGGGTLTGSATVSNPFSIVSGGSYSLTASAWQAVVVRYSPVAPGTNNTSVTFAGGGGATRPVSGTAYACDLVVTTSGDSGPGSLRQAILNANACGGDPITFSNVTGTITLQSALPSISASLNILGPPLGVLAVSGNNTNRVFTINSNVTVLISGLTICYGRTADGTNYDVADSSSSPGGDSDPGAGVCNAGTLTLSNCIVCGNSTGNGGHTRSRGRAGIPGNGGGVYSLGPLTILSCVFSNNATGSGAWGREAVSSPGGAGGGIWSAGPLIVSSSILVANSTGVGVAGMSDGSDGGPGGGVCGNGPVNVSSCVFSNNLTGDGGHFGGGGGGGGNGGAGAGIYAADSLTVDNCTFSTNSTGSGGEGDDRPGGSGGAGGAIYGEGPLMVNSSTLLGNSTGLAGHGMNHGARAGGAGGALCAVYTGSALSVSNCTFTGNSTGAGRTNYSGGDGGSGGSGGGIYNAGTLAVSSCRLNGNSTGVGGKNGSMGSGPGGGDGGGIYNAGELTVSISILSGNCCGSGGTGIDFGGRGGSGGGICSAGGLTLENCTLSSNRAGPGSDGVLRGGAGGQGGAISCSGALAINGCTLHDNSTGSGGAGGNGRVGGTGGAGGGMYAGGLSAMTNCTLTGNSTGAGGISTNSSGGNGGGGGGIYSTGTLAVSSCTLSGNTTGNGGTGTTNGLPGLGGGIFNGSSSADAQLLNTIVALNLESGGLADDASGAFTSLGHNLIGNTNGSSGFGMAGDLLNIDPLLGPLADDGGPTWTCALLFGSPAIDAGTPVGAPAFDQRGVSRPQPAQVDIGAYEYAPWFSVWSLADAGPGSLRQAIQDANALGGGAINASNVAGTITLLSCLPDLSGNISIVGPGSSNLVIDCNGICRGLHILPGATCFVSGLTITNGNAGDDHGGAMLNDGNLAVNDCQIIRNRAGWGGGIATGDGFLSLSNVLIKGNHGTYSGGGIRGGGDVSIVKCVIDSNGSHYGPGGLSINSRTLAVAETLIRGNSTAEGPGGGSIFSMSASIVGSTICSNGGGESGTGGLSIYGVLGMTNCTIVGNGGPRCGGLYNSGTTWVQNCTIALNLCTSHAGGVNNSGTFYACDSIIAANVMWDYAAYPDLSPDYHGILSSLGFNLIGNPTNTTIIGDTTGNIYWVDPLLGPLQDNGGVTPTLALLPESPAIDAGTNLGAPAFDQRGFPRLQGAQVDIGAYERSSGLVVINTNDSGFGSLRQTILDANAFGGGTITFSNVTGTITLQSALPSISTSQNILGPPLGVLAVSGNNTNRVFTISSNVTVLLSGLTICYGRTADGTNFDGSGSSIPGGDSDPGAGVCNAGTLTLSNCIVCGNRTGKGGYTRSTGRPGIPGNGGGVYSVGPLTILNCVLSNNATGSGAWSKGGTQSPGGAGGGIWSAGPLIMSNSILVANSTGVGVPGVFDGSDGGPGAGIYGGGPVTVSSCVFSNNLTGDGGRYGGSGDSGGDGGAGAGIYAADFLMANDCTFGSNSTGSGGVGDERSGGSGGAGGAIYSEGPLILIGSTLLGNSTGLGGRGINHGAGAGGAGGALCAVYTGSVLTVSNCTFTGNSTGAGGAGHEGSGQGGSGGGIYSAGTLAVSGSTFGGNSTGAGGNRSGAPGSTGGGGGGGAIYNAGALTVSISILSGNTCGSGGTGGDSGGRGGSGGGICSAGGLTLENCTLSGNRAGPGSGGLWGGSGGQGGGICSSGTLTINGCTLDDNSTGGGGGGNGRIGGTGGAGGGLYVAGLSTLTNCTFTGNSTGVGGISTNSSGGNGGAGGGIYTTGTLAVSSCTLSGNTTGSGGTGTTNGLPGLGGGIFSALSSADAQLLNTIVALNLKSGSSPDDAAGAFTSLGHNLIGNTNGSSGFGVVGDLLNLDPLLGPLADNGGPTWTCALLSGSPAIDAGTPVGAPAFDQRGVSRPQAAQVDIGASEYAPWFSVWNLADSGAGSLRQAILDANAGGGGTITFSNVTGTITLQSALPSISASLNILGPPLGVLAVSGNNTNRVFNISSNVTVLISGLTIRDGRTADGTNYDGSGWSIRGGDSDPGAGVCNAGTLTLSNCIICGNRTGNAGYTRSTGRPGIPGNGGGVYSLGPLTVLSCVLSNNATGAGAWSRDGTRSVSPGGAGGGIWSAGPLIMSDSILIANSTGVGVAGAYHGGDGGPGAGIYGNGPVTVSSCVFSNNLTGDGGPFGGSGDHGGNGGAGAGIYAANSLTVNNCTFGSNATGSGGEGDELSGGSGGAGGAIYSGGPLMVTSSTLLGNSTGLAGHGINRGGGVGGAGGALCAVYIGSALTVSNCTFTGNSTGAGRTNYSHGDGGSGGSGGGIYNAGTLAVSSCTLSGNSTGVGGSGGSPGAGGGGGDGGGIYNAGALTVSVSILSGNSCGSGGTGLDFGGRGGNGGGICSGGGLTLENCTLSSNRAGLGSDGIRGGGGGQGGGISCSGTLTISGCTLNDNSSGGGGRGNWRSGGTGGAGGGMYVGGFSTMTNCTLSGNSTGAGGSSTNSFGGNGGGGGGIYSTGTLAVSSCTLSGNTTGNGGTGPTNGLPGLGGGIFNALSSADAQLLNTIVALNLESGSLADDASGAFTSLGHNLIGNTNGSSGFGMAGDRLNLNPLLGPLADNGGPTFTCALSPGSPAIDAGTSAGAPAFDQRGAARPQRTGVDMGAYEAQYIGPLMTAAAVQSGTNFWMQLWGMPGENYVLQASTNFVNWVDVAIFWGGSNAIWECIDRDMFRYAHRFYRAAILPPCGPIYVPAASATVTPPMLASNGYIFQPYETLNLPSSGRAVYPFTNAQAGTYVVRATVNAPDDGANSFWVNIDAQPQNPTMIWDMPLTSGFQVETVAWRGTGTYDSNSIVPKVFTLSAGAHQFIVRGREGNTLIADIAIAQCSYLQATSGALTAPFISANGYIYSPTETLNLATAGRAAYSFTVPCAGNYVIEALVKAPNGQANSFWVNIDAEPEDPYMIWNVPLTSNFELREVSWQGNGTGGVDEFVPKVFALTAGTHQLIIRSREANALLRNLTILQPYP